MNAAGRIFAWPLATWMNLRQGPEKLVALNGRTFAIGPPHGAPLVFAVKDGRVLAGRSGTTPDATVRAPLRTYLAMRFGRLDPDAAFFQRRLELTGSLKTAVIAKNVFDGLLR